MVNVPVVASSSIVPTGTAPQSGTAGTTLTMTYPSGVQVGDVLLMGVANGAPNTNNLSTDTGSTSPGWTLLKNGIGGGDTAAAVYWKAALTADTTATTVLITHTLSSPTDVPVGSIVRLNSVATSSQIHSSQVSVGASSTTGLTITALSPAPSATDLVVRFYFISTNSPATITAMSSPSGWTLLQKQFTNKASDYNCGIAVAALQAGTGQPSMTCAPTSGWVAIDVAVVGATPVVSGDRQYSVSMRRASVY
jgi:hypothetical protein